MLFMVIEHFKDDDAKPVYRRFCEKGRLAPDGLEYVSSWVDEDFHRCFQLMETEDEKLIEEWIENWKDLVDFEVFPVMTSEEATTKMGNKQIEHEQKGK